MQGRISDLYLEMQKFDFSLFKSTGSAEFHSDPADFGLVCSLLGSEFSYVRMGEKVAYVLSCSNYELLLQSLKDLMGAVK